MIGGKVIETAAVLHCPVRKLSNGFVVFEVDWKDDPAHTEAWGDKEAAKYGGRMSMWWQQNMERVLMRGGEPVWPMLRHSIHVRPFLPSERLSADWTLYRGLDHGFRHNECCAWGAVNRGRDLFLYRQYYRQDFTVALNAKSILELTPPDESIAGTVADPAIWKRDDLTLEVVAEVYEKNGLPLTQADNAAVGYERLTMGFLSSLARWAIYKNDIAILQDALKAPHLEMGDARLLAEQPAIWFDPSCAQGPRSLYEECANFRWKKMTGDATQKAAPEKYQDVDKEGPDVVRYLAQTAGVTWRPPRAQELKVSGLEKLFAHKTIKPSRFD